MMRSLTAGTLLIIVSGLAIKLVGFASRIIISGIIGAEGMGLYQLFYPFYSMIILTISSGLMISQSSLIAEAFTRKANDEIKLINRCTFIIAIVVSTVVGGLIFYFSDIIAFGIFGEERLTLAIKWFGPFLPIIISGAVIRGYYYGTRNIVPTAVAGFVEQIAKIAVIIALAGWAVQFGLGYSCFILVMAAVFGEVAGFVSLCFSVLWKRPRTIELKSVISGVFFKRSRWRDYSKGFSRIIKICIPVSANRMVLSVLGAIEVIMLKTALVNAGYEYVQSVEEFGRLTGMVLPLIFFPMVFTSAIATTLVPAISEAKALSDDKKCLDRISKAIVISIGSGVIFTAIFLAYPQEIGQMAYRSSKCKDLIFITGFSCVFIYLQQTVMGILNGLGKQGALLMNTLAGFVVRFGSIFLLIPVWGINGYCYGFIASSVVVCIFNFEFLKRSTKMIFHFGKWVFRPLIVGLIVFFVGVVLKDLSFQINERLTTLLLVTFLSVLGYFLLFCFGLLDIKTFKGLFKK